MRNKGPKTIEDHKAEIDRYLKRPSVHKEIMEEVRKAAHHTVETGEAMPPLDNVVSFPTQAGKVATEDKPGATQASGKTTTGESLIIGIMVGVLLIVLLT